MARNLMILLSLIVFGVQAVAQQMTDTLKLYFRQGSAVYDSVYKSNGSRASEFFREINTFKSQSDLFSIISVSCKAGASPEGSPEINKMLSSERCTAIMELFHSNLEFPGSVVTVDDLSEDWSGLELLVKASEMPFKDSVSAVIRGGGA